MDKKKPILQPLLAYAGKRKVLTYLSMVIPALKTPMHVIGIQPVLLQPLHDLYGVEYDAYCKRVNRTWPWFPRK